MLCSSVYKAFSHVIIALYFLDNVEIDALSLQLEKLRIQAFPRLPLRQGGRMRAQVPTLLGGCRSHPSRAVAPGKG